METNEGMQGLISHHGLKYVISSDNYEKIKDDNSFLVLLEQYIEAMESLQAVICFIIAIVLILKKVSIPVFAFSIGFSYIAISILAVKTNIYKIPFLSFFSYYIYNYLFKFFINYIVVLLLSILYCKDIKIFIVYIATVLISNIFLLFVLKNNSYKATLKRNDNIVLYLKSLSK